MGHPTLFRVHHNRRVFLQSKRLVVTYCGLLPPTFCIHVCIVGPKQKSMSRGHKSEHRPPTYPSCFPISPKNRQLRYFSWTCFLLNSVPFFFFFRLLSLSCLKDDPRVLIDGRMRVWDYRTVLKPRSWPFLFISVTFGRDALTRRIWSIGEFLSSKAMWLIIHRAGYATTFLHRNGPRHLRWCPLITRGDEKLKKENQEKGDGRGRE